MSETSTTGNPAAASAFAVPPVDTSSTPSRQPAGELSEPGFVRHTQNCTHVGDFLDIYRQIAD